MGESDAQWVYADNWRILVGFLGAAIVVLGIGVLAVSLGGAAVAVDAGVLLSVGVFLAVFATILLVPRLVRRGVRSFRLYVDRTIEEVEREIQGALEASGYLVTIDTVPSRSPRPPRVLLAEGAPWRIRLEAVSRREVGDATIDRTEVIQIGVDAEDDADAKSVRELVGARLAPSRPGDL